VSLATVSNILNQKTTMSHWQHNSLVIQLW